jgi:predicted peptidase
MLFMTRIGLVLALPALFVCRPMLAQNAITSPSTAQPDPYAVFEARVFERAGGSLPYRLLKPLDYDAHQKYPLVLFLHGAGERGLKNDLQLIHGGRNFVDESMRRRHPAFILAPQCPGEKRWVEVPWDARSHKMPAEPSESLRVLFELISALQKEFSIDEGRVYGVALSMGGFGVWDILQRKPELLSAAVIICGGGDPAYVERFKSTPVWAFHGADDPVVTVERSRDMVNTLRAVGGRPVYTEYEGVQHDSWTRTFDNRLVWDWLFVQHK